VLQQALAGAKEYQPGPATVFSLWRHYGWQIEERHRQVKCFWDLTRFYSTAWSLVVSQTVFVCLTYSLLQIHLLRQGHAALNRRTVQTTRRLLPDGDRVVVYCQQYFAFFTLLEHMELTLSLEEKARQRALSKARELLHGGSPNPGDGVCSAQTSGTE
jgi:hypothetical protein